MVTKKKISKRKIVKKKQNKKKKSLVKKPRKKVIKEKIPKVDSVIKKKDFETFKFGVQRLKELKLELDKLDTRGFLKEEKSIRSKLKNVSEIPNIEKAIKILKLKINKKYKPKRKKESSSKIIQKDIKGLRKEIQKKTSSRFIKENIRDLKKEIDRLNREKNKEKSNLIEGFKNEIKKLKEQEKAKKIKVDSGVGILVDTNFNNFLNQTKVALSERIRKREKEVEEVLKVDLQKREDNFKKKRLNLIREFNQKYNKKLKTTLQKEVSEEFNEKLQNKLDSEKIRLNKIYKSELKQHLLEELEKQNNKLKEKLQRSKESMKEKLIKQFHKNVQDETDKREKALRQRLNNEFELKLKKQIQEHEEMLKKKKLDLEMQMQNKIKQMLK